jgi:SAM-dependent methyltransferase
MVKGEFVAKEKQGKCLCLNGSKTFEVVTQVTREGPGLWEKCVKCGLVINRQGVPKKEVDNFYNDTYQKVNSFQPGKVLTPKEHYDGALHSMRPVAEQLAPYLKSDWRVMDIGAATGEFLDLIKGSVAYCLGIETNDAYCQFMQQELGIDATSKNYFDLDFEEKFDLIVINGTVDHMYNSLAVFDKICYDLKPGGMLYIQSANDNQALRRFLPEPTRSAFEEFMYQRAHYLSFSIETLIRALKQAGFRIVDSRTRHDYTLKNFMHWYYLGSPQKDMHEAKVRRELFSGNDGFSIEMNQLFLDAEPRFHELLEKYNGGEMLCVIAVVTD